MVNDDGKFEDYFEIVTNENLTDRSDKAVIEFFAAVKDDSNHSHKVIRVNKSIESTKEIDRKRHEFKNAVGRVARVVDLLQSGYRFDDERAEKNIEYLKKAADRLEEFGELLSVMMSKD